MLLKPKFAKFTKAHKGRVSNIYKINQNLVKGSICIIATQSSRLTAAQINAVNLTLKRALKKDGDIF
jgi:ribosomal protein L16/L10AE